jgi:hypothetical protein
MIGVIVSAGAAVLMILSGRLFVNAPSSPMTALHIEPAYPSAYQGNEEPHISRPPTPAMKSASNSLNFERLFKDARDFLPFARAARAAAKIGDVDAQYFLSEALSFCAKATAEASYGVYFVNNGGRLVAGRAVLQEGMVRSEEVLTELGNRCGPLHRAIASDESFGSADDWLASAADNGSSAAQSTLALRALFDLGTLSVNSSFGSQIRTGDDARALLVDVAARSDPVALWNLGAAQAHFSQSYEDQVVNRLALWLVSCRSGLDCGTDALWIQLACQSTGCPHNITGPDMIDALAGIYREKVENRAQVLSDALQTGTFTQVNFPKVSDNGAETDP